jgi:hypothetical protein
MANTLAANGFSKYSGTGTTPSFEQIEMAVASTNTTAIFFGDPVVQATGTTGLGTGYITQAPMGPLVLAISSFALSNGLVTATFTTNTAPPVGATLVLTGLTTATTLNGAWPIIASTTTTAVFAYSGAALSTQSTTGYVYTPIAGIFVGCKYLSTAQKRPVWSNYAPGSDYNGDVTAYVINDPMAEFSVQTANSNTTAAACVIANVGQNIGFNYLPSGIIATNGNTANGLSTVFADMYTLAASSVTGYTGQPYQPFRILKLQNYVPGATSPLATINGNDATTAYNRIVVGFNNMMFKQLAGI